jgi:ankyrin repeat protein
MATRKYHKKSNKFRKTRSKKQGGAKMPYVGRYYENPSAKLWDGVYEHDYKMVEEAFKEGADVNMKNDNGVWFLLVASENGNARMVNLLLEIGIDVNITDDYNNTALSTAVRNAKYDVVELLLEKGADINKENNDGDTPLMHAIIFEDYDMVELLLEHPDIDIELDLVTNKELQLAEDMTLEDEDQNGIPYLIEDYIVTKNKIKEHKYTNIKRISNYKRPNVPKLSTLAHRQLSTLNTIKYNNAVKDNTVPPLDGKLGGKRKTRKAKKFRRSKKSKRKTRKSKKY